jgi:hypothetical protein
LGVEIGIVPGEASFAKGGSKLPHSKILEVKKMDDELEQMSREQLIAEVKKLRQGIREHRDSTGHDLCWHHPTLWSLLPEKSDPLPLVPDWPQFMRGCIRYRQSLDEQLPNAPRTDEPFVE